MKTKKQILYDSINLYKKQNKKYLKKQRRRITLTFMLK